MPFGNTSPFDKSTLFFDSLISFGNQCGVPFCFVFMKNFFLKIKHWQLFSLLFLCPLLMGGYFLFSIPSLEEAARTPLEDSPLSSALGQFVRFLSLSFMLGESYMMVLLYFLNERLPEKLKVGVISSSLVFIFSMLYVYAIYVFLSAFFDYFPALLMAYTAILLLLFFCFLLLIPLSYISFSVAKVLTMVELSREVQKKEFLSTIFLFLFLPVGVWFLQPRINRLAEEEALAPSSLADEEQDRTID